MRFIDWRRTGRIRLKTYFLFVYFFLNGSYRESKHWRTCFLQDTRASRQPNKQTIGIYAVAIVTKPGLLFCAACGRADSGRRYVVAFLMEIILDDAVMSTARTPLKFVTAVEKEERKWKNIYEKKAHEAILCVCAFNYVPRTGKTSNVFIQSFPPFFLFFIMHICCCDYIVG